MGTRPKFGLNQNNLYEQINEQHLDQTQHLDQKQQNPRNQTQIHDNLYETRDHSHYNTGQQDRLGYQDDDLNWKKVQENQEREKMNKMPKEIQKSPAELEAEREMERRILGDHGEQNRFEREIMACLPNLVNETYENRITGDDESIEHSS